MPRTQEFTVWTIGHSTHSIEEFIQLLDDCSIRVLADVRMFPGSRRYPQFNKDKLSESLAKAKIKYNHLGELGGRRRVRADSPNTAWRNKAFRAYADYMMTAEFNQGIRRLLEIASRKRTAIMCAEVLWWRCHRALIGDYLKAQSIKVVHILGIGKTQEHPFTSAARIIDGRLSYTKESSLELPL
jgi:uncharacterized protein (DUF488 family)